MAVNESAEGSSPTDRELFDALLNGDPQAMNELLRRNRPMLWRTAHRVMRHYQDAQDVTQIAMLRVWRYAKTYEGRSSVEAWMRTVVLNACYLEIQRRGRLPISSGDAADLATYLGTSARLVEGDRTAAVDLRLGLEKALEHLPEPYRTTFFLAKMCGLTEAETAAAVDVERGTVKSRVARARYLLAEELTALRRSADEAGTGSLPEGNQ